MERSVAINAVSYACNLSQRLFKSLSLHSKTLIKPDQSPVTVADFAAQAVINHVISTEFPGDDIIAEEDSKDLISNPELLQQVYELVNLQMEMSREQILQSIDRGSFQGGTSKRFWTLDPIDGTKGFIRGDQFAVCLSLIEQNQVKLGVIGCPNLPFNTSSRGCIFIAEAGKGSFIKPIDSNSETRIRVSSKDLSNASFCESFEASHSSQNDSELVSKALGITRDPLRMDSQCKYCIVARGDAEIYIRLPARKNYQEKIWDHASGYLLVKEAGGLVTDMHGNDLDFSHGRTLSANQGIIASNCTETHKKTIEAINKLFINN